MMELLRTWLLGVAAAAVLAAIAQSLTPPGPVKKVGGLVCGLVLLRAMLSPLAGGEAPAPGEWALDYLGQIEIRTQELQNQAQQQRKAVIEEELEAYILDKAAQQGYLCRVRVECREGDEGVFVPDRAWIAAPQQVWPELGRILEEDLGIPAQRQTYEKEGAS